jgi:two-component system chemotaxis response regulator CheY
MWKILVVDDNFANRQLIIEILADLAKCDVAMDGREAIEAYNLSLIKNPYDLILLDIAMPEINGIEFLTMVRDNEKKAGIPLGDGIPIIMVTAHKEPFMESFNKGCDDYLLKPIDQDALISKIREKLEK